MLVSLNDLVQLLAARVGEPWNTDLQEQMKVVLNYKRAQFFKRLLDQHPEQRRYFYKDFNVELQAADKAECPVEVDCIVKRSVLQVPLPVRANTGEVFDYVGSSDKMQPYGYATPGQVSQYIQYNRYTSRKPKYYYANGYLYIYVDKDTKYVNVTGVYPDPRQLTAFICNGTDCYSDDSQYEIPYDLINDMIRDTLQVELRNVFPQNLKTELEDTQLNDENNRT
jgi:hypothetical protein